MTALYFYDDAVARGFAPFALTRPVSELRAGTTIIRRRWERRFDARTAGLLVAAHLADFDEPRAPAAICGDADLEPGSIVVNSRCVAALSGKRLNRDARAWSCDGRVAAVKVGVGVSTSLFADGSLSLEDLAAQTRPQTRGDVPMTPAAGAGIENVEGLWIDAPWDLIATLTEQLMEDIPALATSLTIRNPEDIHIIGSHPVYFERGALTEPYVVVDATSGPVLVRNSATVSSFSRLMGPCYVGEHATVVGDRVSSSSLGDYAKVSGEISNSIVLGYSNKGHTGFVGHSYLGKWVNLGSGTTTSNLKNTYGTVQMPDGDGTRDTGQQFLGAFFGDHAKTGIGTMLTTGTIVGAGANVFGTTQPPKVIPPFAWGDAEPYERFEIEKFLEVAERMMKRRGVDLTDKARRYLRTVHETAVPKAAS